MAWILGGVYCLLMWLIFAKLKLIRMTLPITIVCASVGPSLIVALLVCAQYFHPYTHNGIILDEVVPVTPQLRQPGRVIDVAVDPNTPIRKGDLLFRVDPVPYQNTVSRLTAALEEASQGKSVAQASVELVAATLKRAESNLDFATKERDRQQSLMDKNAGSQQDLDAAVNAYAEASAAVNQALASQSQARLSVESASAKIAQTETQLADAKYDLEQTDVVAASDGYVTNLQLREGMMVGGTSGSVMSLVLDRSERSRGIVVAAFNQKNFLRIKKDQYAEVALHSYPGEIFTGRVVNTIDVSGAGQLSATGTLPSELSSGKPSTFAVRIKLDRGDELRLPGGSQADVAVYTDDVQIAGIPIMFVIRTYSWLRYLM